jgi:hypothetical protein
MKPKDLLTCSQDPVVCLCTESDEFIPRPRSLFPQHRLLRLDLPTGLFHSGVPTKMLCASIISPFRTEHHVQSYPPLFGYPNNIWY